MYFSSFSSPIFISFCVIILLGVFASFRFSPKNKVSKKYFFLSQMSLFGAMLFVVLSFFGPKSISMGDSSTNKEDIRNEMKISFVVDVSNSMDTLDIPPESISRLDLVKETLFSVSSSLPQNLYSLGVFAGVGDRVLPFTEDMELFQSFVKNISEQSVQKQGTNLASGIESGIKNFSSSSGGLLVILTDGGEEKSLQEDYKKILSEKNISLLIVGVGSKEGGYIPLGMDVFGEIRYKTYKGEKVLTKVETQNLSRIASKLGGEYMEMNYSSGTSKLLSFIKKESVSASLFGKENDSFDNSLRGVFVFVSFLFFCISLCFQIFPLGKRS